MTDEEKKCAPCEGMTEQLSEAEIKHKLTAIPAWTMDQEQRVIRREFKFSDFTQTMQFIHAIASIAETQGHHPDVEFGYNYCTIKFTTHSIGGLSENDFICAAAIDNI